MTGRSSEIRDLCITSLDALSVVEDGVKAIQVMALSLSENAERAALTYVADKLAGDVAEMLVSLNSAHEGKDPEGGAT
ncbi:hypothetical protein [Thalassobaculum sp.]|uniref:hypothetical protein n=1 Tax=Thalassobaculum sp. TaxID=2022740 RepID=UPI003B5C5760